MHAMLPVQELQNTSHKLPYSKVGSVALSLPLSSIIKLGPGNKGKEAADAEATTLAEEAPAAAAH